MFANPCGTSVPDLTSGAVLSFKCNVPAGGREGLSMGTSGPKVTDTDQDRLTDRARLAHLSTRGALAAFGLPEPAVPVVLRRRSLAGPPLADQVRSRV